MSTDRRNDNEDNTLDELVQSSFGLSDEQILEQLRLADETIDDSEIPPPPEDWDRQLHGRIEAERRKLKREGRMKESHKRKIHRFKKPLRFLVAAIISLVLLLGMGITAVGKKRVEYWWSERVDVRNNVVLNNDKNIRSDTALDKVYPKIQQEVGVRAIKLGYIPEKLKFQKVEYSDLHAKLEFSYDGNKIYFIQNALTSEGSTNIISDRRPIETVYNEWLKMEINIEEAKIDNDSREYSAEMHINDAFYYFAGVMDLEEFKMLIEDLSFY